MNRRRASAVMVALVMWLQGCAAMTQVGSPSWPFPLDGKMCAGACTPDVALETYVKASNYCRQIQNYYERFGVHTNSTKLAIGTVGAISGSVIAPIAKGTGAAAWSGLSGATNALQTNMDQAFSGSINVKRRQEVARAADEGAEEFKDESGPEERVLIAINMARKCSMGSVAADVEVLKALSQ